MVFGNDDYTTNITKDYPVQIKRDSDFLSEHYELPFTLSSVSMNGNELVAGTDYKYMYSLGLFTMLIDCTGPINIKAELSVKHAVKVTSSVKDGAVIKSSESIDRVESSDTIPHLTKVIIADNYLSTYKITGTKEDVNITLDGNKIPCTKYVIFNDLKGAEISYTLPLIPFASDDKDLIIDVPIEPLNDPHDIVMKSGELGGHLTFKAPTNPYISKEFGVDIEVEYKDGDKIKNIVVPNNEQGYANFEATLSDSKNVIHKSSSCKNNNGNLVFSFEKLPADKQFESEPLTFSTNLADNNFAIPVNVNVIVDESTCNKIEMIITGQTTSSKTSSFSLMAKEGTIKSDITAAEVIEILKAAHDSANRKIHTHEINNVTINTFFGITMINFSLNLCKEYRAVDGVPTLCLYNLNNLISQ